jgi:transposase-like protein
MSDDEAYAEFVSLRFAENNGEPYCPKCGGTKLYQIASRRRWKCADKHCGAGFSATSGTIFQDRKLPYRDILLLVAYFVNEPKGISAIRISQLLEISYKSAFVLLHKLREVTTTHQSSFLLSGEVEIDALHCGGYIKPGKDNPSRRNRRRLNRNAEKAKVVMVARERYGRSRALLVQHESKMPDILPDVVEEGSMIFSDSFSGSGKIAGRYQAFRVNHSKQYADGWISTNHAESFFSRLRRVELGTHHKIAGPYTLFYANDACWREDNRRLDGQSKYVQVLSFATGHPVSRQWKGYWQRRKEAA